MTVYQAIHELEASWVVNYLGTNKFTADHVKRLRARTNARDKRLSYMLNIAPKTFVSYTKDVTKTKIDTKEHILKLISLLKHGTRVFWFRRWIQ